MSYILSGKSKPQGFIFWQLENSQKLKFIEESSFCWIILITAKNPKFGLTKFEDLENEH